MKRRRGGCYFDRRDCCFSSRLEGGRNANCFWSLLTLQTFPEKKEAIKALSPFSRRAAIAIFLMCFASNPAN